MSYQQPPLEPNYGIVEVQKKVQDAAEAAVRAKEISEKISREIGHIALQQTTQRF